MDIKYLCDFDGGYGSSYYAKGHVDKYTFCQQIERQWDICIDVKDVKHSYGRIIPVSNHPDFDYRFVEESKPNYGVFKCTLTSI